MKQEQTTTHFNFSGSCLIQQLVLVANDIIVIIVIIYKIRPTGSLYTVCLFLHCLIMYRQIKVDIYIAMCL